MPGHQRILVISTAATDADLVRVRDGLGRDPVVITAPTADAGRVVRALDLEPSVEPLLAPVGTPDVDRGHRLDDLVRRYALRDRFRDVVVTADPTTSALLLRVLAPGQGAPRGSVTEVGLARGDRPVVVRRAVAWGLGLGVLAGVAEPRVPILALPVAVALVGLVLLLVERWRHVGWELLLAAAVAVAVVITVVAGSARFPAG